MKDKKEELQNLEQLNAQFVQKIRQIVKPFIKNFLAVHLTKVENDNDKKLLLQCINIMEIYSLNEEKLIKNFKFVKGQSEREILKQIKCELEGIKKISNDAYKGNLNELQKDIEEFEDDLEKLNDLILYELKQAA